MAIRYTQRHLYGNTKTFFRNVLIAAPNTAKYIIIKSLNLELVENTGPIKLNLFNKLDYIILISLAV